jgi:hypothetical protein
VGSARKPPSSAVPLVAPHTATAAVYSATVTTFAVASTTAMAITARRLGRWPRRVVDRRLRGDRRHGRRRRSGRGWARYLRGRHWLVALRSMKALANSFLSQSG